MQKIFRVRNTGASEGTEDIQKVNNFINPIGKIISVTPCKPIDEERELGSWLIVADDGKEYKIKDPLE
jgi:hypothetical protein